VFQSVLDFLYLLYHKKKILSTLFEKVFYLTNCCNKCYRIHCNKIYRSTVKIVTTSTVNMVTILSHVKAAISRRNNLKGITNHEKILDRIGEIFIDKLCQKSRNFCK